jgi:outer membrane protein insertion porin family/translocation and assembly module TamA
VFFVAKNRVRVDILIEEGPPVLIARVDLHGLDGLPKAVVADVTARVRRQLKTGRPFQEDKFDEASKLLRTALEDNGYAYAKVERAADVDLPNNKVAVGFFITLGPLTHFGEVTISGLGNIPEGPVRRALDITPGTLYSRAELDAAQRALLDLNVFSSVVVEPDLSRGANLAAPQVPIKVTVEPAKLKAIHVGGGAEIDSLKSEVHLIGGWEHRNLFGGLRSLTFEVKPGLVLYPTRFPSFAAPEHYFPEGRFNAQFRQPGFLEARTGLFTRVDGSVAPLILAPHQDTLLGYRDTRLSLGLDRSLWRLYGSLSHTVQFDSPFTYLGSLDRDLKSVVISYPELMVSLDLRDQRVRPHQGAFFSNDLQIAGIGGNARDIRTQTEGRGYIPLRKRWTLAVRTTVGFLFPANYGDTIEATAHGQNFDTSPEPARAQSVQDIQLMFLRGFFSGGAGSNRGYALREVGPHGVVPQASTAAAKCTNPDPAKCSLNLPLGGFTLWEASLELRFPLKGALTGALFVDTSDVSDKKVDFRFNRPHMSPGLGFRYDTPVGPIRLDAGYRIPGLQAPSDAVDEGVPAKGPFGAPVALSFGIGEAF